MEPLFHFSAFPSSLSLCCAQITGNFVFRHCRPWSSIGDLGAPVVLLPNIALPSGPLGVAKLSPNSVLGHPCRTGIIWNWRSYGRRRSPSSPTSVRASSHRFFTPGPPLGHRETILTILCSSFCSGALVRVIFPSSGVGLHRQDFSELLRTSPAPRCVRNNPLVLERPLD